MVTEQDYALLSLATYVADPSNRLDPELYGWTLVSEHQTGTFYGAVYR
jgi:hypothetical protein